MSSIVPFDSGKSYAVRAISPQVEEYRFTDRLGRTQKDRDFLEQLETIFLAAGKGDLKTCQAVVEQGFCDFHAVTYGKFGTSSGKYLNNISPLQIAEMREHQDVVNFFKEAIARSEQKNIPHTFSSSKNISNANAEASIFPLFLDKKPGTPPSEEEDNSASSPPEYFSLFEKLMIQPKKTSLFEEELFSSNTTSNTPNLSFRSSVEIEEQNEFAECKRKALLGDEEAIFMLGEFYAEGYGCGGQKPELAFKQFKKLAEKEDPLAQLIVANYYEQGFGVEKDPVECEVYLTLSAEQGDPEASFRLAWKYHKFVRSLSSDGIKKIYATKASQHSQMAADKGHIKASILSPYFDLCADPNCFQNPQEEPVLSTQKEPSTLPEKGRFDSHQVLNLLEKAQNNTCSAEELFEVAQCYVQGKGTSVNLEAAFVLCKRAAELGNAEAQCALVENYIYGYGVDRNYTLAFKYAQFAADQKNPRGLCQLAHSYAYGMGTVQNSKKAFECAKESADLGDSYASLYVALWYAVGFGTEKNEGLAFAYCKQGADGGDPNAEFELAHYYATGFGIEKDFQAAVEYCSRAAAQNQVEAADWLPIYQFKAKLKKPL